MTRVAWILCLCLLSIDVWSASEDTFSEGVHYRPVTPQVPTSTQEGTVEVVELFWYGCPHCFDLEPYIAKWLKTKPETIEFIRLPATLNPRWITHARTFYALELMGTLEQIHPKLYSAIHNQGRKLKSLQSVTRFLDQQGVDEDSFLAAYNSLAVETKLRRAMQLNKQYAATGVPAAVVNGKYLTSVSMAGGYDQLFKVVEFLANKDADD